MNDYAFRFINFYIFKHIKRIWIYNIKKKPQSFPSIFQIQTINQCNGSCYMCPNSKRHYKKIEIMSDKLFKKIITEINDGVKSKTVLLMYLENEPLMDDKLFQRIKYIKDLKNKKIITGFLSNGSLFTREQIQELEKSDVDFISFSIDALTSETFNKIRGGFSFENVINNLYNVLESEFESDRVAVEFVLQKNNIHEFKDFKKFWKNKVGGIVINHLTNRSGDLSDFKNISLNDKDFPIIKRFGHTIMKKLTCFCPMPITSFNILSNGDVIPCTEDYNKKSIMGNVKESTIKEIWKNKKYRLLRDMIYKKKYYDIQLCKNCSRWRLGIY